MGVGFGAVGKTKAATFENARYLTGRQIKRQTGRQTSKQAGRHWGKLLIQGVFEQLIDYRLLL